MSYLDSINRRILLIDDDEGVRDNFRLVLRTETDHESAVDQAASAFFGQSTTLVRSPNRIPFELDTAENGRVGLEMVQKSLLEGRPYAAIFCDIRMPGWDGLETVQHIHAIDRRAEIIFVTAFSDYTIDEIVERAGANVSYFIKPFSSDELHQVATKAIVEWNKARELESLVRTVTSLRGGEQDIDRLLEYLLDQLGLWLNTPSTALAEIGTDGAVRFRIGTGDLANPEAAARLLEKVDLLATDGEPLYREGATYLPIGEFGLAIAMTGITRLTPDRAYLIRVFLENAAFAIKNAELKQRLVENERMAAAGQAISYIVHDLRTYVGNAQMFMDLLLKRVETPQHIPALADRIQGSLSQALMLVGDTLDFARGSIRIEPRQIDLSQTVREAIEFWTPRFSSHRARLVHTIEDGLVCNADAQRLLQVLHNLVKNGLEAVAAMPDARVEVSLASADDTHVLMTVSDNGGGIPADLQGRIFEPFVSMGKRSGTGFGLAIVKQIVDAHEGRIDVVTGPDGTSFSVFIPR
jgi:two-component system, NtrC family, sensor kinase